jgi:hypothetical protein
MKSDETIQEAIRLHEAGELTKATEMFGRLAEGGNVLSQVLYGLSLRHGWGCTADTARAVTYLSAAAANSASIESEALASGMKKGGAAKGELVLAIFELANCFRHGWGVQVDKVAARQYYETAANLGDTDAMNEAAWCYLEGFGGKKDKVSLAACQWFTSFRNSGPSTDECGLAQPLRSMEACPSRSSSWSRSRAITSTISASLARYRKRQYRYRSSHYTGRAPLAIDDEIHAQPKADYDLDRFWAISDFQLAMLLFWARPRSDSTSFTLGSNAFTSVLSCCLVPCISYMHISTNDGADIGISTVQSRAITPTRRKKWFQDTG